MRRSQLFTRLPVEGGQYTIMLDVIEFQEGGAHLVVVPALDLTGTGDTAAAARASLHDALIEFLRYTNNKGTLPEVLGAMGWQFQQGKGKNFSAIPPSLFELARQQPELAELLEHGAFTKYQQALQLPIPA